MLILATVYAVEVLVVVTVLHVFAKHWTRMATLWAPWFFYQMHKCTSKELLLCSGCHFSKHQCSYAKPGAMCHFTPKAKLTVIQVASFRPIPIEEALLKKV